MLFKHEQIKKWSTKRKLLKQPHKFLDISQFFVYQTVRCLLISSIITLPYIFPCFVSLDLGWAQTILSNGTQSWSFFSGIQSFHYVETKLHVLLIYQLQFFSLHKYFNHKLLPHICQLLEWYLYSQIHYLICANLQCSTLCILTLA